MDPEQQRAALEAAIGAHSLAALSRMLGRNPAWLQQYLRRGTPRLLPEGDRRRLAAFLGLADSALGGPQAALALPRLDIAVSAGGGRFVEGEVPTGEEAVAPAVLRRMGARAEDCALLRVEGDSMAPLLAHGDQILVDRGRTRPDPRGQALWVVRDAGGLRVKRLRAEGADWVLLSENPGYPPERVGRDALVVVGRVLRVIRDL